MIMPRYVHTFNMPVTGVFTSEYKDFEKALRQHFNGLRGHEAIKSLIDCCDTFYSIQNIEPTDIPNNPAEVE